MTGPCISSRFLKRNFESFEVVLLSENGRPLLAGKKGLTALCVAVSPPQQSVFSPWNFVLRADGIQSPYPPASKSTSHKMDSGVEQKPLVFLVTNAQEVGLQMLGQGGPSKNHL